MHQPFHDLHSGNAAALRQTPRGRLFCLFKFVNRKQLFFSFLFFFHRLRGHFTGGGKKKSKPTKKLEGKKNPTGQAGEGGRPGDRWRDCPPFPGPPPPPPRPSPRGRPVRAAPRGRLQGWQGGNRRQIPPPLPGNLGVRSAGRHPHHHHHLPPPRALRRVIPYSAGTSRLI